MNNPFGNTASQSTTTQASAGDGISWWFKWLIKIVAVVLGVLGLVLGILTAVSIEFKCIIAGVILM
jgi:hypothetical protein